MMYDWQRFTSAFVLAILLTACTAVPRNEPRGESINQTSKEQSVTLDGSCGRGEAYYQRGIETMQAENKHCVNTTLNELVAFGTGEAIEFKLPHDEHNIVTVERKPRGAQDFATIYKSRQRQDAFTDTPPEGNYTYRIHVARPANTVHVVNVSTTPRALHIDEGTHARSGRFIWDRLAPQNWQRVTSDISQQHLTDALQRAIYGDYALVFIPLKIPYHRRVQHIKQAWRAGKMVVLAHGSNENVKRNTLSTLTEAVIVGAENPLDKDGETSYGRVLELDVSQLTQSRAVPTAAAFLAQTFEMTNASLPIHQRWWNARSMLRANAALYESENLTRYTSNNRIPESQRRFEGWHAHDGASVTVQHGATLQGRPATNITITGGGSRLKYYTSAGRANYTQAVVYSMKVKNTGEHPVRVAGRDSSAVIRPGEYQLVRIADPPGRVYNVEQLRFETTSPEHSVHVTAADPRIEFVSPRFDVWSRNWTINHGFGVVVHPPREVQPVPPQPPVYVQTKHVQNQTLVTWNTFNTTSWNATVVVVNGERVFTGQDDQTILSGNVTEFAVFARGDGGGVSRWWSYQR